MPEPLEQPLDLDITAALASLQTVDAALQQVAANFGTALTEAVAGLTGAPLQVDTSAISGDVQQALFDAAGQPIPVEADTSAAEAEVSALDDQQLTLPVEADTAAAEGEIGALDSETVTVPVEADVAQAQEAIDSIEAQPIDLPVEVDTAAAEQSVAGLGDSAAGTTSSLGDLTKQSAAFGAVSRLGTGDVSGLGDGIGILGGNATAAVAGLTAGAAAIGFFFTRALDAQDAVDRMNESMGVFAGQVNHLHVGNLTADLDKLALSLGSDDDSLRQVATTFFQFQTGAGIGRAEAAKFSATVVALSARAVALNPALGGVDQIAQRLGNTLARGGRFLSTYGLNITSAEIRTRAMENAQKGLGDGTSAAALQIAGGQIAIERYGDTLDEVITRGTERPVIQLRALRQRFEEVAEAIGRPLVAPVFQVLTDIEPVAEQVGKILGDIGGIVLPALVAAAPALVPLEVVLGLIADGLGAVAGVVQDVPAPLLLATLGVVALTFAMQNALDVAVAFGVAIDVATGPIGILAGGLSILGLAVGHLGPGTQSLTTDTSALAGAFDDGTGSAAAFSDRLANLTKTITTYLQQQLAAGDAQKNGLVGLHAFGLSYDDLSSHLSDSTDKFFLWYRQLRAGGPITDDVHQGILKLSDVILDGRDALEAGAQAALNNAVQTGSITAAQRDAAVAATAAKGATDDVTKGERDYLAALRALAPEIDRNTITTQAAALAAAQASPVYHQLVEDLAAGRISVDTFSSSLEQFGFNTATAAAFAQNLNTEIGQFVQAASSKLPDASQAITDFSTTAKKDFEAVGTAIDSHKGDVGKLMAQFVTDSDPARFTDNLVKQITAIAEFGQHLAQIAVVAPELADRLAAAGPEAAGLLASGFASDLSKAKTSEGVLRLLDGVTGKVTDGIRARHAEFAAAGGVAAIATTSGITGGLAQADFTAAGGDLGAKIVAHFHPDLKGNVDLATRAAAQALAGDPRISQAAGDIGLRALQAFQDKNGPVPWNQAAKIAVDAAHSAIANDQALPAAAGKKGTDTAAAFRQKATIAKSVQDAIDQAAALVPGLDNLPNVAGLLGSRAGDALASGFANGMQTPQRTSEVANAAGALASIAVEAINRRLGIRSPSTVGIEIGSDFTAGIVIGMTRSTALVENAGVAAANAIVTATGPAFVVAGRAAVSNIVAGFNDPATIEAATAHLQELVARATAAATTSNTVGGQISSIVTTATGALPGAAAAITEFGTRYSTAVQSQTSALSNYHQAYVNYRKDLDDERALQGRAAVAAGAALVAHQRLNAAAAAHLPHTVLQQLQAEANAADATLKTVSRNLDAVRGKVTSDRSSISDSAKQLRDANRELAAATDPRSFIRNLNDQTRANEQFEKNLRKLVSFGDTDLAAKLAELGPAAAGKLAAGLASNRALAKTAEAAVDHAKKFADTFDVYVTDTFAPKAQQAVAVAVSSTSAPDVTVGVTVDTTPATAGLAAIPTVVPVQVVPQVQPIAIPPIAPAHLDVIPRVELPLPPLAPIPVEVIPHLGPIAPIRIRQAEPLQVPPLPDAHLAVIPRVLPLPALPDATFDAVPRIELPLPALPEATVDVVPRVLPAPPVTLEVIPRVAPVPDPEPIAVEVIPDLDPIPSVVPLAVVPRVLPLPALPDETVAVVPVVAALPAATLDVTPLVPPLPPLPAATFEVIPRVDPLPPTALDVIPRVVLPLPALEPLDVKVIPHLEPIPALANLVLAAAVPTVATIAAPPSGPTTLELDLTITLPDGTRAQAQTQLPVPAPTNAKTRLRAAVQAKVIA